jgi:hypothetical protein
MVINSYTLFAASKYATSTHTGTMKFGSGSSTIKVFKSFCIRNRKAHAMIARSSMTLRTVVCLTDPFARFLAYLHAKTPTIVMSPAMT